MEFIIFMSKLDIEIIELIKKAKYQIVENTSLCKIDKKFMGFHKGREKTIVICTNNAKLVGNYSKRKNLNNNDNNKTKLYLRRALRHEATHLAQSCNGGKTIKLLTKKQMKLHKGKFKALKSSVIISGKLDKEIEAYLMEDKPRKVREGIIKYCL